MFDMSKDTYTCDFCEFEMQWDGHDEVHGEVWAVKNAVRFSAQNASSTVMALRLTWK